MRIFSSRFRISTQQTRYCWSIEFWRSKIDVGIVWSTLNAINIALYGCRWQSECYVYESKTTIHWARRDRGFTTQSIVRNREKHQADIFEQSCMRGADIHVRFKYLCSRHHDWFVRSQPPSHHLWSRANVRLAVRHLKCTMVEFSIIAIDLQLYTWREWVRGALWMGCGINLHAIYDASMQWL